MTEYQTVFGIDPLFRNSTGPLPSPPELSYTALESRVVTGYIAAASAVAIILQGITRWTRVKPQEAVRTSSSYVKSHGGQTILAFQVLRLLANGALFVLAIFTAAASNWSILGDIVVVISSAYALSLATLLLYTPLIKSSTISFHATVTTLGFLGAYAYRDIWPSVTLTLRPADANEGWLLWSKVIIAGIAGVFVPMYEPYVYCPYDPANPQKEPNPEQTTSLFGFFSYSFISSLVYQAQKTPHLSADMFPPQLDVDQMRVLRPGSSRYFNPSLVAFGKVRVRMALLALFAGSWARQVILVTIGALGVLGGPVGTNRLLAYIEKEGVGAVVRPWVWILFIALSPLVQNVADQLYLYYSTRTFAHMEAIITSVLYQHSLRIRVINQTEEEESTPLSPLPLELPKVGIALEPAPAAGSGEGQTVEAATIHSRAESSTTGTTLVSPNGRKNQNNKITEDEKGAHSQDVIGKLNVLVTSDLKSISDVSNWIQVLLSTTLQFVLGSWFLYTILGWSALVGVAVMAFLIPIPAWVTKLMSGTTKLKMKATDRRIQYIKEVLTVLRMIKIFGGEKQVKAQMDAKRAEELALEFRRGLLSLANVFVNYTIPLVHMVVTFILYTTVQRGRLSASIVFSALTAFNMIRSGMNTFIMQLPSIVQANVSLGRMQEFLNEAELLDQYTTDASVQDATGQHTDDLGLAQASFFWSREHNTDGTLTPSREKFRLRIDDDVVFTSGLNLIVGPTGSGKTSLLMALLGEMHYVPSGPGAWANLPRKGGVAYCAQEPWIQSMSIRDNILFGAPYDETKYMKVIHQCSLKRDLSLFDAGDATEIGERGLTLSGGQKARIALARAVYSSAKVILLDDILAALDVHTSVWIVTKCLKGDLLKGRTILLVTHNIALTSPIADYVVSMGADGRIVSQGPPASALVIDRALTEEIMHEQQAIELEEDLKDSDDTQVTRKGSKLVVAEEIHHGHVSWKALMLMISNFSSWPMLFCCGYVLACIADEAAEIFQIWWLGWWATQYSLRDVVDAGYYLGWYAATTIFIVSLYMLLSLMATFAAVRVGRIVHDRLTATLLASTFRWLDMTPTSRVIARCTQDIQSIDGYLVRMSNYFVAMAIGALSRLIAITISAPAFILPAAGIGAAGVFIGQVYIKAQLSVKRERSNAKAPVVAAVNEAFSGIVSIRAFNAQAMFTAQTDNRVNKYTQLTVLFSLVERWVSVRIQLLSTAFAGGLAFYLVYGPGHRARTASTIGYTLSMAVFFCRLLLNLVRVSNMLETEANSLERIQSYLDIEKEPEPTENGIPPAYWPASGALRVENLTARYSSDGPVVLDSISFDVKAGERIGIVGRTGSGKSTLTLALLRCIVTSGELYYDGIPTSSLNLDAVRSNITIIPQAPELLSGTLRKNLDMFGQHNDAELNDALRSAGLFSLQTDAEESRLTLDSQIAAGGGNLSVGQRQIIALARALVRQSKLLVLDEATSAIDYETDAVIQTSLRTELKSDVTVITVAHRLQTVMDSDRIMVLDAGKIVEFDSPQNLLQRDDSFLRALVDESADKEALHAMAK